MAPRDNLWPLNLQPTSKKKEEEERKKKKEEDQFLVDAMEVVDVVSSTNLENSSDNPAQEQGQESEPQTVTIAKISVRVPALVDVLLLSW